MKKKLPLKIHNIFKKKHVFRIKQHLLELSILYGHGILHLVLNNIVISTIQLSQLYDLASSENFAWT